MPRPVEGTSPYNAGLDGLRAIAVLGVVAYHLEVGWASGGLLGVAVFFVLSGYLITDLLMAQLRRRGTASLGRFWVRRARRLLPALFLMLAVTVVWATLFNRAQLPSLRSDILPAAFYFSNWWYIFHHVSYFAQYGPPSPLNHLWSLAIEEQFYLLWPLALLAALRWVRDKRLLFCGFLVLAAGSAVAMALLYVPYTDPTRVYDGTDTRAFELLIGAALAIALPRDRPFGPITRRARQVLEWTGAAAIAAILFMYWGIGQYDPFAYRGGMVVLSVVTALLIAVCVHPGARVAKVLGVAPLRWIGERSYGIYLWSVPVIVLSTPEGAKPSLLRDVLQVVAIFVLSALSWRFVEQPVRHGALGRLATAGRDRWRRGEWRALLPRTEGLAATSAVLAGGVICSLGLSGVISGASSSPGSERSVLPPRHHVEPVTQVSETGGGATGKGSGAGGGPAWISWQLRIGGSSRRSGAVPLGAVGGKGRTAAGEGGGAPPPPAGQGVTVIGDSIMVDAAPYVERMLPGAVVDAQIGQQLYQVLGQVATLRHEGDIGDRLVLELGTNGYFSVTQLEDLLRSLGPMRRVVLVNTYETRPWEEAVNQTIATVAHSWHDATMVNWNGTAAHSPQYFEPDGVHLDPQGAQYYASMLVRALEAPNPTRGTASRTRRR